MSFLAPLYIAGALAVALPILFHLIRRSPTRRQTFSSLMFLAQTPPRITRRSRLSNILLLLLRAAALTLLALAFARPFFARSGDMTADATQGRRIALLVDTSASMRRGDLWTQATRHVEQVLSEASVADEVALFAFDRNARPLFTFDEWNATDPSRRGPLLRSRLAEVGPTWNATHLGDALATVADQIAEARGPQGSVAPGAGRGRIVLVSDLQQGSHAAALQGREWPEGVRLDVRTVGLPQTTNAGLQLVQERPDAPDAGDGKLRVRLSNQPGAAGEQFALAWANSAGPLPGIEPQKAYVPAGRSQVVRVARPPADAPAADRLVLQGDDFDFDNTLYVAPPRDETARLVYVGNDAPDDPKGLSYYLRNAVTDMPGFRVEFAPKPAEALAEADLAGARLAVVATALPDDRVAMLRAFVESGGEALWVLKDASASAGLARLLGVDRLTVEESPARDFALIGRVELNDPLFSAFNDPRFADFTKVRFWKHRKVTLPDPAFARVLARFDDGDPFLFEKPIGKGRLVVATSGWQPADSQLALSTKFVPLIGGLLQRRAGTQPESQGSVGEPVALPAEAQGPAVLHTPDGRQIDLRDASASVNATDRPGTYRLDLAGKSFPVAVNLAPDESRTAPLLPADLEQWGAKLAKADDAPEAVIARQRELRQFEIENRQKIWRWLIVLVLGLVAAETVLAGWLARRAARATSSPDQQQPSASPQVNP